MGRALLIAFAFLTAGSVCAAQEEAGGTHDTSQQSEKAPPQPAPVLTKRQLFHKYVENTIGPEGMFGAALDAGIAQWRQSPPEWEQGTKGYAKRWASAYGQSAISDTTKYAVSRIFHHDPSYQRCECTGFGPRFVHAVLSPFKARNRSGEWVWSPAIGASMLAGHIVPAATWYPSDHGARDGLQRAGTALVSKMGARVFREFITLPKIEIF